MRKYISYLGELCNAIEALSVITDVGFQTIYAVRKGKLQRSFLFWNHREMH